MSIGAAIGAAAGSILAPITGLIGQNQSEIYNRRAAEKSRDWELQMWNRQNEYNTPEAQQQRIKDAGLNPHLMYGKGTTGNSTTLPKYTAPQMQYKTQIDPMATSNAISQYQDFQIKAAQIQGQKLINQGVAQDNVNKGVTHGILGTQWESDKNRLFYQPGNLHEEWLKKIKDNLKVDQETEFSKTSTQFRQEELRLARQNMTLRDAMWARAAEMIAPKAIKFAKKKLQFGN